MSDSSQNTHDTQLAKGDTPDFKWYIAKAQTGQENKVTKSLKERIVNHKMTEFFSDILSSRGNAGNNSRRKKENN